MKNWKRFYFLTAQFIVMIFCCEWRVTRHTLHQRLWSLPWKYKEISIETRKRRKIIIPYCIILCHCFLLYIENIRIFHGCEVWIEKTVPASLLCITRLRRVMPNSDPEGWIFLSAPNSRDRFFFLHTFWSPAFDFNVGVAINESHSYTLTSAILKVEVVCDVTMTSTRNVLTTELRDLYDQRIDNTCCCLLFIYPTGRIRVCKIRFVSTGENCGKPCLVCKKSQFHTVTLLYHEYTEIEQWIKEKK